MGFGNLSLVSGFSTLGKLIVMFTMGLGKMR
jgi:hypothetical protein